MTGRAIACVGPSGAGKDTVMDAVRQARPEITLARRVITRPEALGGEDFEGVSEAEFDRRREAGAFALHWQAHGLSYGIPRALVARIEAGETMFINLSRAVLAEAHQVLPGLIVLEITARPEVRAARLAARGRETVDEIAARLARPAPALPPGLCHREIDNSGALEDTVRAVLKVLEDAPKSQASGPRVIS
ncbi:MAG: phosphonate metabolism protein/1,5-bisphosphokinase (PRPP-forming) PhnN [Pseudomonadota bacterium]